MNLSIAVCATKSYCYALLAQSRTVVAAIRYAEIENGNIIIVGDDKETLPARDFYIKNLPKGWEVVFEEGNISDDSHKNYKEKAQLTIASLRQRAFEIARNEESDACLSLDSDVLIKPNSITVCLDMLSFDKGYYSVACLPYPSQGGGPFLCGRGDPNRHIFPNFYTEEREIPQQVSDRLKSYSSEIEKISEEINNLPEEEGRNIKELTKRANFLSKKISLWNKRIDAKYHPKKNIFELNGKSWKRRGWFDFAYPAIGKGSVVPTDWCGFGATMMNKEALSLVDFFGYEGKGTEDLFIIWKKWFPRNIRMCAIPHCPADHVIRDRSDRTKLKHIITYHEDSGELVGHLRQKKVSWNLLN